MGRARKITDEQILEAAREIFLGEGFGASTVEIARQAGVSEGSIFKRFQTKENLFFAAMGIPAQPEWVKRLEILAGQGNLKENLVALSLQMVDFFRDVLPRLMMASSKGQPPRLHGAKPPFPPHFEGAELSNPAIASTPSPLLPAVQDLEKLTHFFERELELGRIRPCNPESIAYMLLGSLMHYIFLGQMQGERSESIEAAVYVQEMIEVFWRGIAPD